MKNYKLMDHTADIALQANGNTIEELFIACAEGFKEISLVDKHSFLPNRRSLYVKADSLEELLVSFLDELNFLIQVKKIYLEGVKRIVISQHKSHYELKSVILISILEREEIKTEIKAVTFHQLKIKKCDDFYSTTVVFDT